MEPKPEFNTAAEQHTTDLITILGKLEDQIKRQNSLRYAFVRGMIYGLGTVIGATVLVALFGGVIVTIINTFSDEPISESVFERIVPN